jgi:ankyrin repeat protein
MPLHIACGYGHAEVSLVLLDHGAEIDAKDKNGGTPLHDASYNGHAEVSLVLLGHGAELH